MLKKRPDYWRSKCLFAYLLLPFSWIFQLCIFLRYLYYCKLNTPKPFSVPVIIVGNITVGGSGKTPMVCWLAKFLKKKGFHPGIVSRGFKSKLSKKEIVCLAPELSVERVGDEAYLLGLTGCPVVLGANRVSAVEYLLQSHPTVNVIICDDGLQHYALARDIEIALLDGTYRLGNGFCLPAGPLREPPKRLCSVDFVVVKGGETYVHEWSMHCVLHATLYQVSNPQNTKKLASFIGSKVHAVAGIGNPSQFFSMLKKLNVIIIEHVYSDHYPFCEKDLIFNDTLPILMTEKDAVKCRHFSIKNAWAVPLEVELPELLGNLLLQRVKNGKKIA